MPGVEIVSHWFCKILTLSPDEKAVNCILTNRRHAASHSSVTLRAPWYLPSSMYTSANDWLTSLWLTGEARFRGKTQPISLSCLVEIQACSPDHDFNLFSHGSEPTASDVQQCHCTIIYATCNINDLPFCKVWPTPAASWHQIKRLTAELNSYWFWSLSLRERECKFYHELGGPDSLVQ